MRREQAASAKRPGPPAWRSPIVVASLVAIVFALVVIGGLNLGPAGGAGSPSATPSGAAPSSPGGSVSTPAGTLPLGLTAPAVTIPSSIPRDGRTLGSPTAPVSLEIWADFQCPACGNFTRTIEPVVIDRYVETGKVKLTFHDYAFIGDESLDAAAAARCAAQQDRFWEYSEWLYANQIGENQGSFTRDRLAAIADQVGLDPAAWAACYDGGSERTAVAAERSAGSAAGVNSTPTLFLDGTIVPLSTFTSWDDLYAAIDAAIAAAGGPSTGPSTVPSASPASPAP